MDIATDTARNNEAPLSRVVGPHNDMLQVKIRTIFVLGKNTLGMYLLPYLAVRLWI